MDAATRARIDRQLLERAIAWGALTLAQAEAALARLDRAPPGDITIAAALASEGVAADVIARLDPSGLIGTTLGGFRLEALLGVGGMGSVFAAEQLSLRRPVAVKVLDPTVAAHAEVRERFRREALMAARLEHPHVVRPVDFGEDGGHLYFAMERLTGGSVATLLEAGPLPERRALEIARDVARALVYAEERGLVHRDVKPANILFDARGETRLADLGLALDLTALERAGTGRLTRAGVLLGSPHYMAPEQARAEPLDGRADAYALGITLFEMLAGRPPFDGASAVEILTQHSEAPLPDPVSGGGAPAASEGTKALLQRLCAKRREDRFPTAGAALEAIEAALDAPAVRAGGASLPQPQDMPSPSVAATPSATGSRPTTAGALPAPAPGPASPPLALPIALAVLLIGAGLAGLYARGWSPQPTLTAADRETLDGATQDLATLLLARRTSDGGFGEGAVDCMDAWVAAEATLALLLLEDPAHRPSIEALLARLPALALDGAPRGRPGGFAGFPYRPGSDNVECVEATAAVGLALALAQGRGVAVDGPFARAVLEHLLAAQNAEGSWSRIPLLGEKGALTGATAVTLLGVAPLAASLGEEARAAPAIARASRWLARQYNAEAGHFEVNPRRRTGADRRVPGLDEGVGLALLEGRALLARAGAPPEPALEETLLALAAAFRPSDLPPTAIGITSQQDYYFPLEPGLRATMADDRWLVLPYRLLLADALARTAGLPRRDAWQGEAARLLSQLPALARGARDLETWQVAEALLGAAMLRLPAPPEGRARTFTDLVRRSR